MGGQGQASGSAPGTRLVVCVLTFRRERCLSRLLPLVVEQVGELDRRWPGTYDARVLVVDNDPSASAADVVAKLDDGRIAYVVEPVPGISAARNRALSESVADDLLVFIDDDETPRPGWLAALVATHSSYGAGAVAGRVVSEPEGQPDPFVVEGGYFERSHRATLVTGAAIVRAATNNLLLDLKAVRSSAVRFDERFGTSGGEDSLFTGQLHGAGVPMVWCAEAVVTDHVPTERLTREYAVRRTVSLACSGVHAELALLPSASARAAYRVRTAARELLRLTSGWSRAAYGIATRSLRHEARGVRSAARARGAIQALLGRWPSTYGREEG